MKFQPFGERVVVRILQLEEVTESGLVITSSKGLSNKGIVEAIGEEIKDYIKVGDTVIFNKGAGTSYSNNSEDYKVLHIRDILGKIIED
jgi:chaperonin GroES